jgi:hypothetical protein
MTIICLLELTPTLLQMQFFKHFHNFFVVQDNGQTLLKFGSLIITVIYLDFPIFFSSHQTKTQSIAHLAF